MDYITFTVDELLDFELDFLKEGFKKLSNFTLKTVGNLIGTKKVYNKEIIKVMSDGFNHFQTKVIFKKNKYEDLSIFISCKSPNGIDVITMENTYKDKNEDIVNDINYIIENIERIKG